VRFGRALWQFDDLVSMAWLAWRALKKKPDKVSGGLVWLLHKRMICEMRREDPVYRRQKARGLEPISTVDIDECPEPYYVYDVLDPTGEKQTEEELDRILRALPRSWRIILKDKALGRSQAHSAKALGITQSRVSQIFHREIMAYFREHKDRYLS
jgi:predicted XRE-type DNA-binding protein